MAQRCIRVHDILQFSVVTIQQFTDRSIGVVKLVNCTDTVAKSFNINGAQLPIRYVSLSWLRFGQLGGE